MQHASAAVGAKSYDDMAEGPSLETYTNSPNSLNGTQAHDEAPGAISAGPAKAALLFAGLALVGAVVTFAIVRNVTRRRPSDPTTERIQQLIDEANRLLKQLDEKQPGR